MIGGQVEVKFGVRWAWKGAPAKSSLYDVWALDGSERVQFYNQRRQLFLQGFPCRKSEKEREANSYYNQQEKNVVHVLTYHCPL